MSTATPARGSGVLHDGLPQPGEGLDAAFESLYRTHRERVLRLCRAMVGHHQDAEEAAQATMLNAYRALERGDRPGVVGAWLTTIARNECRDLIGRRRAEVPLPDALPAVTADPADVVERRERMRELGCDEVRPRIESGDGRALRARRVRAHLRVCEGCREAAASRHGGTMAGWLPVPAFLAALRGLFAGGPAAPVAGGAALVSMLAAGALVIPGPWNPSSASADARLAAAPATAPAAGGTAPGASGAAPSGQAPVAQVRATVGGSGVDANVAGVGVSAGSGGVQVTSPAADVSVRGATTGVVPTVDVGVPSAMVPPMSTPPVATPQVAAPSQVATPPPAGGVAPGVTVDLRGTPRIPAGTR